MKTASKSAHDLLSVMARLLTNSRNGNKEEFYVTSVYFTYVY